MVAVAFTQCRLTDHELDIIIMALYEAIRTERGTHPRTAKVMAGLRKRLLVQRVARDGGVEWGWVQPALPSEST